MKIRLICRFGYQITEDSFNAAYRTFDILVPKELEQDPNISELIKNNLIGAEVIVENDSDNGGCSDSIGDNF